jgi:hypothetical protein
VQTAAHGLLWPCGGTYSQQVSRVGHGEKQNEDSVASSTTNRNQDSRQAVSGLTKNQLKKLKKKAKKQEARSDEPEESQPAACSSSDADVMGKALNEYLATDFTPTPPPRGRHLACDCPLVPHEGAPLTRFGRIAAALLCRWVGSHSMRPTHRRPHRARELGAVIGAD